jgi:AraC-like DNA-binding protein/PAS domain-containing protein
MEAGRKGIGKTARRHRNGPNRAAEPAGDGAGEVQSLPLEERLRIREAFFRGAGLDPRQFLQAFDNIPGLFYFVKDAQSRTMLNTREYAQLLGHRSDDEIVGKRPSEYLARDLADHYEADDQKVLRTGQPLRNILEIGFNEQGVPDWIITDKYPLRDASGRVVGIMGTMQSLEGRVRTLPHLGEVGKAAAFIRENLGEPMLLADVAAHVGMSERHLQRLFHKLIGMPIQRFIIHSRVHAAAYELTHSERPMSEIALMFGFSDQSAFTNTFRKLTGVPPREYRNRHLRNLTR